MSDLVQFGGMTFDEQVARVREVVGDDAVSVAERHICPLCGQGPWRSLIHHVLKGHGLRKRPFNEGLGVPWSRSWVSQATSEVLRELAIERDQVAAARTGPRKTGPHSVVGRQMVVQAGTDEARRRQRHSEQSLDGATRVEVRRVQHAVEECEAALVRTKELRRVAFRAAYDAGGTKTAIANAADTSVQNVDHVLARPAPE